MDLTFNESLSKLPDNSIVIKNFSSSQTGNWMVTAHNNVGKLARRQIVLEVKQDDPPIKVSMTKSTRFLEQEFGFRSIFSQMKKLLLARKPTSNVQYPVETRWSTV